jgi:hypothetical protein
MGGGAIEQADLYRLFMHKNGRNICLVHKLNGEGGGREGGGGEGGGRGRGEGEGGREGPRIFKVWGGAPLPVILSVDTRY